MTDLTRRTALRGVAAGGVAAIAGCAGAGVPGGDGSDGDGSDGGGTDGSGGADGTGGGDDDTGGSGDDDTGSDGAVETAVQQVGPALLDDEWSRTERRGYCALIADDAGAERLLGEAPEPVRAFVAETDFAESVLCYVESVGPTTCHDEVAFSGVGVADGTLAADATVRGPADDEVACGEAITFPAALLRVTSDPLPDAARIAVTDGWGETGTVRSDGLE